MAACLLGDFPLQMCTVKILTLVVFLGVRVNFGCQSDTARQRVSQLTKASVRLTIGTTMGHFFLIVDIGRPS